mmetsp:Transcript_87908/g.152330  ORF Transcript_87908/g.152330 Transcript_87908/m.152330 type:complete len:1964 (-) Transcript_87908:239-6130(-)
MSSNGWGSNWGNQQSWNRQQQWKPAQASQQQQWKTPQQVPAQQGQKPGVPAQVPARNMAAGGDMYVVTAQAHDMEEIVVRTLVGEYKQAGENHGRKVYKKISDTVDVFMYYWDNRDGPAFEGWWFGNQLGGTQVWSLCKNASVNPPPSGWQIPWDGAVRPSLAVTSKAQTMQNQFRQQQMEADAASRAVLEELQGAESAAQMALEQSKGLAGDGKFLEGISQAEALLAPQVQALGMASKRLLEAQRSAKGGAMQEFQKMGQKLRTVGSQVRTDLDKLRLLKAKAEKEEKERALEENDRALFQEIMPEAIQKTNFAEDAVEKAAITAEMINGAGDDMEEVRNAVNETEQAAREAQTSIGEARIFLNTKQTTCKRFQSEKMRKEAMDEFSKLMQQLQAAQTKLTPLKTVRQDYIQRSAAKKLVAELMEKLTPAEVEVDKADEATQMLFTSETVTKETLQQAEKAVAKATEQISAVVKLLEAKVKQSSLSGAAREEISKLEERVKGSRDKLANLKTSQKDANERISSSSLTQEAAEKLKAVEDAVSKVADAEAPFLMGVEELPLEETLTAVKMSETAATSANTSLSICRMFLATKLVEVKRFSAATSAQSQAKLKAYQKDLEGLTKKLTELKGNTAGRKKTVLMREAEGQVNKAEELAQKVAEFGSVFEDDTKLMELPSATIKEASENTAKAEKEANTLLAEARKYITARQIEAKGKDSSEEISAVLLKYQTRLSQAQSEVSKYKKLSASVEGRLAAKKHIEEAVGKVKAAEEKVEEACSQCADLEDMSPETVGEKGHKDAQKNAESAAAAAVSILKTTDRYLQSQTRASGLAKEEIAKLQPKVKALQDKLEAATTSMREKSEKLQVQGIIHDSKVRVEESEASVKKVAEAEKPFKEDKEMSPEEAAAALNALETAAQAAHSNLGSTKTFIAMKRLAAKRLAEAAAKSTAEELAKYQERLDVAVKQLQEIKKGMSERRAAILQRENAAKVEEVQKKVAAATEATKVLASEEDLKPEAMKEACEKAGSAQQEAQTLIEDTRTQLLTRQKDAKATTSESPALTEIAAQLDKITELQKELNKEKALLRDSEHKFVGRRLLKDATDRIEALEKKLETTTATAAPLVSDDREDFTAGIFLQHIVDAMKQNAKKGEKLPKDLYASMQVDDAITEEKFVSFATTMPELVEEQQAIFSEEQLKTIFKRLDSKGEGKVTEEVFLGHFVSRYICINQSSMTESLSVKGGKTIRKLEVNEVFTALEDPAKDPELGLMRVKVKADKDSKEGYITLAGNQGTKYLETFSAHAQISQKIEGALKELQDELGKTTKHIENKVEELKAVRTGPLAETKTELTTMKPRIAKVQFALKEMKKKTADSKKAHDQVMEVERQRRQEAAEKKAADTVNKEAEDLMTSLADEVEKVVSTAEGLVKGTGAEENVLSEMEKAEVNIDGTLESIGTGLGRLKELMDSAKTSKGPFSEVRSNILKIKAKMSSFEGKCKKQVMALRDARKKLVGDAGTAVLNIFRLHARAKAFSPNALFKELGGKDGNIPLENLKKFIEKIPDSGLKAEQLTMGLSSYKGGLSMLSLQGMLQEYNKCVKEIAITTAFTVKESKTLRKLAQQEIVEVLEPAAEDKAAKMQRIKCRTITDQKEGWATLKGNQGTSFLEPCMKPYYCCEEEVLLNSAFESNSSVSRTLAPGNVLEILEGPKQEPPIETLRVKCKASKDGKVGWLTSKDFQGNANLEPVKLLLCKASIAMTTAFDMTEGKAIRKLDIGETLELLEAPKEDAERKLLRVKAKTKKDEKEGWVTMKGNQGTSYVEETDKLNVVKASVALDKQFATNSTAFRKLEVGEVVEVVEGPKTEKKDGPNRVRVRTVGSEEVLEGWFTLTKKCVQSWSPSYKCIERISVLDGPDSAKEVASVEAGDILEALEAPRIADGALHVKVRVEKDGVVGFATVKETKDGKTVTYLETAAK